MSEEMRAAESFVLRALESADRPLPPEELLERAASEERLSPTVVRRALWHLVSSGQVEFTKDMLVEPAKATAS